MRTLLLLPALALLACSNSVSGTNPTADVPDAATTPTDVAAPRDVPVDLPPVSPTGLDARPRNTTCVAFPRPTVAGVGLTRVFAGLPTLASTVALVPSPLEPGRWFAVSQSGTVSSFAATDTARAPALNIAARLRSGGEAGLLGMAFHPDAARNRFVFFNYTAAGTGGAALTSRISRFTMSDNRTINPDSERIILEVAQPFANHNGGGIAFGPDGMLYIGFGDGGSANDPMRNGQNLNALLGKFLRIDVNVADGAMPRYAVPPDNPFAMGGGRPEIWAWGLRNPWRFSFDTATGELWAGDVGQNRLEEVDLIRRAGNYGWNTMEGTRCLSGSTCNQAGLVLPVVEYGRSDGASITGGYVYRGRAIPSLVGSFIYGDFVSGRLWAVSYDSNGAASGRLLASTGRNISSFAQDADGEVYVVSYDGRVDQITPSGPATDMVPRTLTATGCVDPANPLRPASGLIPYAPNAPFWSDNAEKARYLALPEGGRITVNADGDWDLPVGTVLVKDFTFGGRRIETRLMVRHEDGDWAGYTYAWNDAQTDATLLDGSLVRDFPAGRWVYPSRAQCMECHTRAAGRSLGLETPQLNGEIVYPATGRRANQLATLEAIGAFAAPLGMPPAMLPRFVNPYGTEGSDETRARAYLHTNCAQCHRPEGPGRGAMDLRFTTSLAMTGTCNAAPMAGDLGVADARQLSPGAPERSLLVLRSRETGLNRMPPIGSGRVDEPGVALLERWIRGVTACP
ncbi:MAG: PQQ-dependent sugar dehydrogenase [Polyangiales bacterium]